jgi:serine/threonine protein kinase
MMRRIAAGSYSFQPHEVLAISPEAKDIVSKMLTRNSGDRLDAGELLGHEWFDDLRSILDESVLR